MELIPVTIAWIRTAPQIVTTPVRLRLPLPHPLPGPPLPLPPLPPVPAPMQPITVPAQPIPKVAPGAHPPPAPAPKAVPVHAAGMASSAAQPQTPLTRPTTPSLQAVTWAGACVRREPAQTLPQQAKMAEDAAKTLTKTANAVMA